MDDHSILTDIKKLLGITEPYTAYDTDIIIAINSCFATLHQLGVGPEEAFKIDDATAVWSDFIGDHKAIDSVKDYIFVKTKLIFDPPLNGAVMESYREMVREYEWRLSQADDLVRNFKEEEDSDNGEI